MGSETPESSESSYQLKLLIRQRVAEELRKEVIVGELPPGQRLTEWSVATKLGVSRGPVREALRELESEGLIHTIPNRGAVVVGMTDGELLDLLLPIRLEIEYFSAMEATKSEPLFDDLEQGLEEIKKSVETNEVERLVEADMAFHQMVVEASQQPQAIQLWHSIKPRIQAQVGRIVRGLDVSGDVVNDHQILIDVLKSGDSGAIRAALERHIVTDANEQLLRLRQAQTEGVLGRRESVLQDDE